jgi:hypothetical protein
VWAGGDGLQLMRKSLGRPRNLRAAQILQREARHERPRSHLPKHNFSLSRNSSVPRPAGCSTGADSTVCGWSAGALGVAEAQRHRFPLTYGQVPVGAESLLPAEALVPGHHYVVQLGMMEVVGSSSIAGAAGAPCGAALPEAKQRSRWFVRARA